MGMFKPTVTALRKNTWCALAENRLQDADDILSQAEA
jgi:hypothetical protein